MNEEQKTQLALVEVDGIYLFDEPNKPAELYRDSPTVGHPRRPLDTGKAKCGLVTIIGPENHADFSPIEEPVQVAIVLALFELKRSSLS